VSWDPDLLFPESIVPEGEPGATTGGIAHHQQLGARLNAARHVVIIGPEGTESDIADALADANDRGYGTVVLAGDSYDVEGLADPAFEVRSPRVVFDMGVSNLVYTGDGVCVGVRIDPFTVAKAGVLRGGFIDGTGAGDGAIGVQCNGAISLTIDGTFVSGFDGVDSANFDFFNDFYDDLGTWTERGNIRAESRNGTYCYRFRKHAAASPSFFYNDLDLKFNVDSGQTALKTEAGVQVFDCGFRFRGNVDNDGTIFDLASSSIVRPFCDITVEQTNGTGAVLWGGDGTQIAHPRGRMQVNGIASYGPPIIVPDWGGSGENAVIDQHGGDQFDAPFASFGIAYGPGILSPYATVYNGAEGNGWFVRARGFGQDLSDSIEVFGVTPSGLARAAVGFRPGNYSTTLRNALGASAVPEGTMIWDSTLKQPIWSDGSTWVDANGDAI